MSTLPIDEHYIDSLKKLTKDLRKAAATLTSHESRFLVDAYYTMQDQRIRTSSQIRALSESGEPHAVIDWYFGNSKALENGVRGALGIYAKSHLLGQWAQSICGIGPVISAGLLAHVDVTKPTCGHVWRYAGLDPTSKWEKGQVRPWNASLKTLCWKIGECFVKVQSRDGDVYGKVYRARKDIEINKNIDGEYADQAEQTLKAKKYSKTTEAYKHYTEGNLPPAHIHARARRYAVKLFLSHYHAVGHFIELGRLPPRPWVVEFGGHADVFAPPNIDLIPGMAEAWQAQNGNINHDYKQHR